MSEIDIRAKEYVSDPVVFADLFNYFIYRGKHVIDASKLVPVDTTNAISLDPVGTAKGQERRKHADVVERRRDVAKLLAMKDDGTHLYAILGVEIQSYVDYLMPLRCMFYDAMSYLTQANEILHEHQRGTRTKLLERDEYLSRFAKTDRLKPVVTIALNLADREWDGALNLHELLSDIDPQIAAFASDYHLNLIDPYGMEDDDFSLFESDAGTLLGLLKYANDEKGMAKMLGRDIGTRPLSPKTARLFNAVTGSNVQVNEEGGGVVMSLAIDRIIQKRTEEAVEKAVGEAVEKAVGEAVEKAVGEAVGEAEEKQALVFVKAAMSSFGVNLEEAMEKLGVSETVKPRIRELING